MSNATVEREKIQKRARVVIKDMRMDSDMCQGELGKKTGMSRAQIANLESGRREIQVSDFVVIKGWRGRRPLCLHQPLRRTHHRDRRG